MNKEIQLLIDICRTDKKEFSPDELAVLLNLKFREGVYPYLRKLTADKHLVKTGRAKYSLNESSDKVNITKFLLAIFGRHTELLLGIHTRNILLRFAAKPVLNASALPYHNLRKVKDIVKKTRIIHETREGNTDIYFIRSWEDTVKRLLQFFDIKLQFDEEEFKHTIIKRYSAFTGKQTGTIDEKQAELTELNMKYYLEGKDFILDKLKNLEHRELTVLDILTRERLIRFTNPFEITRRINDWKIKYVYNTDKIEGNSLTFEEVKTVLTIGSGGIKKEKKDVLETENSKKALDNIFDTSNELTLEFIKKLHLITQNGIDPNAGDYKKEENCIIDAQGNLLDNTTPSKFVEERMTQLIQWYLARKSQLHPFALAAVFHNQFVYIHPFEDGNGRVARLLLNFILIKSAFFPIILFNDEKQKYYSALRQCKDGDLKPFLFLMSDVYRTQLEYFEV